MSDVTYNDMMKRYTENMSKMTQAIQGVYTSDSYIRAVQSAQRLSKELQEIYANSNYIKSIRSMQRVVDSIRISVPNVYYNPNTLKSMTKLAESLSKSSFASFGNKDLYDLIQRNYAFQMKTFKNDDFIKLGEIISRSAPDIDTMTFNLQHACKTLQVAEYSDLEEIAEDLYDEYSSDIEKVLNGELSEEEIVEKNKKSEGKFAKFIHWLIIFIFTTFISGYIEHLSEPVYELIDKVIVKEDIDDLSKEIGVPGEGTKFTIWAKKDGYVEISYENANGCVLGFISEDDLNNKSQLVQDAIDEEQVIFVSRCMLLMSEYWNIDYDETYKRLNGDFSVIKEYIIPEYDSLAILTDEELVTNIDREYKKSQNMKADNNTPQKNNYSDDELRFVVFCIESLAEDRNKDPVIIHDALTKESDIVDQYIIPCYETLHTQGKDYIIENLKEVMTERGIIL